MDNQRQQYLSECKKWLLRLKEKPHDISNLNVCRSGFACIEVADSDQRAYKATLVSLCDYLLGNDKMALLRMPKEQRSFFENELGLRESL